MPVSSWLYLLIGEMGLIEVVRLLHKVFFSNYSINRKFLELFALMLLEALYTCHNWFLPNCHFTAIDLHSSF